MVLKTVAWSLLGGVVGGEGNVEAESETYDGRGLCGRREALATGFVGRASAGGCSVM